MKQLLARAADGGQAAADRQPQQQCCIFDDATGGAGMGVGQLAGPTGGPTNKMNDGPTEMGCCWD